MFYPKKIAYYHVFILKFTQPPLKQKKNSLQALFLEPKQMLQSFSHTTVEVPLPPYLTADRARIVGHPLPGETLRACVCQKCVDTAFILNTTR